MFCSEERVLLQKLLLLHVHCSRLWVRLGEMIANDDLCCYFHRQPLASTALEHNRPTNTTVLSNDSSAKGCNTLLTRFNGVTISAVGEESVTNSDGTDCVLIGDGSLLQFSIPAGVLQSLTCFVAAT